MTIAVVGNYCHDLLLTNDAEHRALGSAAAYASAVLEALGADYQVIANVGTDFRYHAQVARPPRVVAGAPTTAFVDDYREAERRGRVEALCAPIAPEQIGGPYALAIACGIAGEVGLATLSRMRARSEVVAADAQSLLREVTPDGEVVLRAPGQEALELVDWLKASRSEARLLDVERLRLRGGLLVTDGANGLELHAGGSRIHVPAQPAREVDPTGAGDCFLAGFCWALTQGRTPRDAAAFGAFCGARAVEVVGVPRFDGAALRAAFD